MRKLICAFIALVFCFACLSGCHGSKRQELFEMPEEFDTSKQYEIVFWAKNDNNSVQQAIYKKTVADFEALYPNIKVKLQLYSDYGMIYNDVITNISLGTTPNVCITYPDHIATYITGDNTVVPLDELMADEKYGLGGSEVRFEAPREDEIIEKFLDEGLIGGVQYAIPFMRSTEACYINKTMVEKLGFTLPETLTWDFIWEVCEKAMEKDAEGNFIVNGQKTLIPCIYKSTDNMMIRRSVSKERNIRPMRARSDFSTTRQRNFCSKLPSIRVAVSFPPSKFPPIPATSSMRDSAFLR